MKGEVIQYTLYLPFAWHIHAKSHVTLLGLHKSNFARILQEGDAISHVMTSMQLIE